MAGINDIITNISIYQIKQYDDGPVGKFEYEFSVKNNSRFNVDSFSKQSCIPDGDRVLRGYDTLPLLPLGAYVD